MKDMKSPMVSVDITDPSMADAEVMDMDDFGADNVAGEEGEKVSNDASWFNWIYTWNHLITYLDCLDCNFPKHSSECG